MIGQVNSFTDNYGTYERGQQTARDLL